VGTLTSPSTRLRSTSLDFTRLRFYAASWCRFAHDGRLCTFIDPLTRPFHPLRERVAIMAAPAYGQANDQVQAMMAVVKTLTVDKLKNVLRQEGLTVSGIKSELQIRIIARG